MIETFSMKFGRALFALYRMEKVWRLRWAESLSHRIPFFNDSMSHDQSMSMLFSCFIHGL